MPTPTVGTTSPSAYRPPVEPNTPGVAKATSRLAEVRMNILRSAAALDHAALKGGPKAIKARLAELDKSSLLSRVEMERFNQISDPAERAKYVLQRMDDRE